MCICRTASWPGELRLAVASSGCMATTPSERSASASARPTPSGRPWPSFAPSECGLYALLDAAARRRARGARSPSRVYLCTLQRAWYDGRLVLALAPRDKKHQP